MLGFESLASTSEPWCPTRSAMGIYDKFQTSGKTWKYMASIEPKPTVSDIFVPSPLPININLISL